MKLIILDSNSLINRAFYAMPGLTDGNGRSTGGVYGFLNMLHKLITTEKPTHIAAAFDLKAPTFRHKMYTEYKAGRSPMPEELKEQFPYLKDILRAMKICVIEKEGYEADDILGTLSKKFDIPSILVSGDKDVFQLIDEKTTVYHTKVGITNITKLTPQSLVEIEGFAPENVVDLKALKGDSSDNIPGVAGIGDKTAKNLIEQYGTLDGIYENIQSIKGKLKEKLETGKEMAYMSKTLATIDRAVPLDTTLDDLKFVYPFPKEAENLMLSFDFKKLADRLEFEEGKSIINFESKSTTISSIDDLDDILANNENANRFVFDFGKEITFAFSSKENFKIEPGEDLLSTFTLDEALSSISNFLKGFKGEIVFFDSKSTNHSLYQYTDEFIDAEDVMLMLYVIDANHNYSSSSEALKYQGYSGENLSSELFDLYEKCSSKLRTEGESIYLNIEKPLIEVLFEMERAGFNIDTKVLSDLNDKYGQELFQIDYLIHTFTENKTFNVNSPKQLAEVLYDELNLPSGKKRSTDVDTLKYLQDKHPIIPLILRYRRLSKLIGTYLTGMTSLIASDGKLHTVFKQALTTTGRLSSTQPNLQNIPVRTEEGREIRSAFIPSKGNCLIVADYSQIELRLLAHFSQDDNLVSDFIEGKDIHTQAAAAVFHVDESAVSSDMRRSAKAVNFGIIYGISDFGLSDNIGCSIKEAREFIASYFAHYPKIKTYMDGIKAFALENGYVSTFTGRIRRIPEIKNSNYNIRSFGERAAMNMPLQGSASDIIKLAMIKVFTKLKDLGSKAKLIMQVHDELIIDCPEAEAQRVAEILKSSMESVATLNVPLIAEVGIGQNWLEAK